MTLYRVCLDTGNDGRCMVHVTDLPGCIARASSREEALRQLPDAIRDYYAWLLYHGEPVPLEKEPIEVEVAEESTGFGPFDPGDAAALFSPDRKPISLNEMEGYFRLMAHGRSDLLSLVSDLPRKILDWKPDSQSFSTRRLLRHIGNAEEWYVSRIVPSQTLPPEWAHDSRLPLLEFLEMERRTAVARLRQLTAAERSNLFYSHLWTKHPKEPWTARKVLRRFIEHEREHTTQIRAILLAYGKTVHP